MPSFLKMKKYSRCCMKVLFLQNSPCIRNYKYAKALAKKGILISLAYTEKSLSQRYPGLSDSVFEKLYHITDLKQLWDISSQFDLIHSHNEPDTLTVAALASGIPVIHDTHDLISLRDRTKPETAYFEGIANRGAHGRIYSTPYQMNKAKQFYGVKGSSQVIYNYISLDDKPKAFLPKLSEKDGKVHIVYEGGLGGAAHRKFTNIFIDLALQGFMVHIYPATFSDKIQKTFEPYPNIFYNKPVSPEILMTKMTQFDYGIIPWNVIEENREFLDSTIANKLFEYLAAGLPVFTSDVESYRIYFSSHPYGMIFYDAVDLKQKLPLMEMIKKQTDFSQLVFSYEDQSDRIIEYYEQVIKEFGRKSKTEQKDISSGIKKKKVLYLAFIEPKYKQLFAKMNGQVNGLKSAGLEVKAFALGKSDYQNPYQTFHYINSEGRNSARHIIIDDLIQQEKPDYIYFRYPNGYHKVLDPLSQILSKYKNVFYEHNTNEEDELRENNQHISLEQEIRFGRELVKHACGLIGVTSTIIHHQHERTGKPDIPSIVIGNGIVVNDYPMAQTPVLRDEFVMLFTGYFALHHGLERIFKGIAEYNGIFNIKLLIAGRSFNSEYENDLRELAKKLKIDDKIIFLGEKNKEELDPYFNIAHLCIGSLGLHRINQKEASSLKTRECIARGKAIVLDHKDADIDADSPFVYTVEPNESSVSVSELIDFYEKMKSTSYEIRTFAIHNLDWNAKMEKLADFMEKPVTVIPDKLTAYSFVLPVYDDFENTLACLQSIATLNDNFSFEIIIVNNQCSGQTAELLYSLEGDIQLLNFETVLSLEGSYRLAERVAKGKILKINTDFRIHDNWLAELVNDKCGTFRDKNSFLKHIGSLKKERMVFENQLSEENRKNEVFYVKGPCGFCHKDSEFMVDWQLNYHGTPGYRERLVCKSCHLTARKRMVASYLTDQRKDNEKVLCFEYKSKFFKALEKNIPAGLILGCEYLGENIPSGEFIQGVMHQDIMATSFKNESYDYIVANDVLEHVSNYLKAFRECLRLLKPQGKLIFTIPFHYQNDQTTLRAKIENNQIVFLNEPVYHGDPIRKEGSLVFNDFGWDIFTLLKDVGFKDAYLLDKYNVKEALFGDGMMLMFIAEK